MAHTCVDCGKQCDPRGERCKSCAARHRWAHCRKPKRPFVVFEGVRYFQQADGYWRASRHAGNQLLHRAVWEHANGPLEPGVHVHHIDGDASNNDLSNLEPIVPSEHSREHYRRSGDRLSAPAVRQRNSEAKRAYWAARQPIEHTCEECGETFLSRGNWVRFCSPRCNSRWWNRKKREDRMA